MTPFKLLERIESHYLDPSRIYKVIRRKHQTLHKHNITYLYAASSSLNRFYHLTMGKVPTKVPTFGNPVFGKTILQFMEDREW
jgi:hypothetical protein